MFYLSHLDGYFLVLLPEDPQRHFTLWEISHQEAYSLL